MILFAVNDAGPGKYLAYIMKQLDKSEYVCLASEISAKVFDDFQLEYVFVLDEEINQKINLIITGTCLDKGIDKEWVHFGKSHSIKTISVIEHWTLYKRRFFVNGKYEYPDMIFLNDDIAKSQALADSLIDVNLQVVGNPVFEYMKASYYSDAQQELWKIKHECKGKKVITFISEEYRDDFPKESKEYPGFDEYEVISDILNALPEDYKLIIKLHPAEDATKYDDLISDEDVGIIGKTGINELISNSDVLVGMGSMLLLEASLIHKKVFSYRPNERIEFIGNMNGMTKKIEDEMNLQRLFINNEEQIEKEVSNNFKGSTQRIVNFIKEFK